MTQRAAFGEALAEVLGRAPGRAALLIAAVLLQACGTRDIDPERPVFADVAPSLERACVPCHGDESAEAGWRATTYLEAIGCAESTGPVVEPPDERAPILAVLEREGHPGTLSDAERSLLEAWVRAGSAARHGAAHPDGWVDPRSGDFHGTALADEGWVRMLDDDAPGSCVTCHGSPAMPEPRAPGATPCATCHRDEGGPLACSTCHGQPGRPYPPRDPCFHPEQAGAAGAHEAHHATAIGCAVCHGERSLAGLGETEHGDGVVQVVLDPAVAGAEARWEADSRTCVRTCHDRGGTETAPPGWDETLTLGCGSCHGAPPEGHYAGTCDGCHAEASADGTSLSPGPLHANGRVDLGDGSGTCGACHGRGEDPWPSGGAHPAHRLPRFSEPIGCDECHAVPTATTDAGHFDDTVGAEIRFGALAAARGAAPTFEGGRCNDVACHGAGISGAAFDPAWTDRVDCGGCHGLPPLAPHSPSISCGAALCHGGYVAPGPLLTPAGIAVHIDGNIDLWSAP